MKTHPKTHSFLVLKHMTEYMAPQEVQSQKWEGSVQTKVCATVEGIQGRIRHIHSLSQAALHLLFPP